MWAWVGPSASGPAARGALAAARGLARARRHVGPVSVTAAGREPLEFAALFRNWRWCDARRDVRLRAARSATTRLDAVSLASNAWLAAEVRIFYSILIIIVSTTAARYKVELIYFGSGLMICSLII